jgi:uncharacterized protein (DUF362 family)
MIIDRQTRRTFLSNLMGLCVAGPAVLKGYTNGDKIRESISPIRKRLPNPYMENGKPIVLIVRGNDFSSMLKKGMEILGGFSTFGTDKSVIVKPNFVFDKRTQYPTTSDEGTVLATVKHLQKEGFKNITVADRRGKKKNGRAGGKFEWSGMNDMARTGGFTTDSLMDDSAAETVLVKDKRWEVLPSVGVIKKIYEADLIINMPTLKRHTMTNLTCSLKGMMGVLDVPTTQFMHLWGDENKAFRETISDDDVLRRLCLTIPEVAMAVSPEMTVIDARKVLCKDHVSVRTGEPREANRLIISGDSLAADIYAAKILKELYEPYELGYTKNSFDYAAKLGIGVADPDGIVLKEVEV